MDGLTSARRKGDWGRDIEMIRSICKMEGLILIEKVWIEGVWIEGVWIEGVWIEGVLKENFNDIKF